MRAHRRHRLRWLGVFPDTGFSLWWAPRATAWPPESHRVRLAGRRLWIESKAGLYSLASRRHERDLAAGWLERGVASVVGLRAQRVLRRIANGEVR